MVLKVPVLGWQWNMVMNDQRDQDSLVEIQYGRVSEIQEFIEKLNQWSDRGDQILSKLFQDHQPGDTYQLPTYNQYNEWISWRKKGIVLPPQSDSFPGWLVFAGPDTLPLSVNGRLLEYCHPRKSPSAEEGYAIYRSFFDSNYTGFMYMSSKLSSFEIHTYQVANFRLVRHRIH